MKQINDTTASEYFRRTIPRIKLEHAFEQFDTQKKVSEVLGVSDDTVRRLRNIYGMKLPPRSMKYEGEPRNHKKSSMTLELRKLEEQGVELTPQLCAEHLNNNVHEILNWTKCMRWKIQKKLDSIEGFAATLYNVPIIIGKGEVTKFTHRVTVKMDTEQGIIVLPVENVTRFVHDVIHSIDLAWLVRSLETTSSSTDHPPQSV